MSQKSSVMRTEKNLLDSMYVTTISLQGIEIVWELQAERDLLHEIRCL